MFVIICQKLLHARIAMELDRKRVERRGGTKILNSYSRKEFCILRLYFPSHAREVGSPFLAQKQQIGMAVRRKR